MNLINLDGVNKETRMSMVVCCESTLLCWQVDNYNLDMGVSSTRIMFSVISQIRREHVPSMCSFVKNNLSVGEARTVIQQQIKEKRIYQSRKPVSNRLALITFMTAASVPRVYVCRADTAHKGVHAW